MPTYPPGTPHPGTGYMLFNAPKVKESANKMINSAKEVQRVHSKLQSALSSVSWWKGDSKSGFTKRANTLLESVNSTATNALYLGNVLLEVAKSNESDERRLEDYHSTSAVFTSAPEGGCNV